MQSQNRLLDDLARVASGALGVAAGMRGEVEARLREQFERIVAQMDLVTREEHDVALAMVRKAREDQEAQQERIDLLERRLAELEAGAQARTPTRSKAGGAGKGARSRKSRTRTAGAGSAGSGRSVRGGSGATGEPGREDSSS